VPMPPDYWYEWDLHALLKCDALLRMPGISVGADREVEFARAHGIPVFDDVPAVMFWAGRDAS
jgi:hypothetical protein